MSGRVGDLSPQQQEALARFRENLQDLLPILPNADDYFLLRWLRARNFDLQKSEDMLRRTQVPPAHLLSPRPESLAHGVPEATRPGQHCHMAAP
ncbi:SEC14L4 isoform 1 [Pan troglodytes]|uniref:SEC14L4 isoform 1 n=1 Tax=Pan troglodytes TaxID=9598 RepID=A0A2J8QNQ2_PANTR|nr:SEC14L4 isoform 1 [Pan troglodytes]